MQGGYRRTRRVKGPPAARRKLERKDRQERQDRRRGFAARYLVSLVNAQSDLIGNRFGGRSRFSSPSERNRNFMFARLRVTCDLSPINYPRYRYSRLPTAFPMSTGRPICKDPIRTRIAIASVPLSGSLALFRERDAGFRVIARDQGISKVSSSLSLSPPPRPGPPRLPCRNRIAL